MALRHSSGRLWITDPSDTDIVFDTNERLFIATNFVSGSQSVPQRLAQWNRTAQGQEFRADVNIDTTYTLATIDAGANAVIGAFKVTTQTSPQGVHDFGWFSAGGTYVHSQLAKTSTYNGITHQMSGGGFSGYTFLAAGGSLVLHERCVFQCPTPHYSGWFQSMLQNPMTIEFKLYVGTYV